MTRTVLPVGAAALFSIAACSRSDGAPAPAPAQTASAKTAPQGELPRLVFFMNPNGAPCQMQDRILEEMTASLGGKVEVVRYSTTQGADRAMFEKFGIRSLPTLVYTDAAGRELRRVTPGIQSAEDVLRLVEG